MIIRMFYIILSLLILPTLNVQADSYLITNARLAGDDAAAPKISLLIKDGRIADVGSEITASDDVERIDANGGIVTPGLMNSATRLGLIELYSAKETVDYKGSFHNLGAAFDVQYGLNSNSVLLDVARSEGLARAVVIPDGSDKSHFAGLGLLLHLREGAEILHKPRAMLVVEAGGTGVNKASRSAVWLTVRQALRKAQKAKKDVDEATEILQSVLSGTIPLVIKASRESDIRQAINLGKDFKVRIVIIGGEEAWRVAPALAAQNIAVIINPYDILPATFDAIGSRGENPAILHKAGVKIGFAVTSIFKSHNAGTAMRISAGFAVSRGLDKQAALEAMTKNPAEIWGIAEDYGTLEVGKVADIVIWSGDPLEPLTIAEKIFIDGKMIAIKSRQMQLRDKYHPFRNNTAYPPAYQK
ncbi:MAG: amidohydrolase family protein [Emcibacter sp.]|nr:amidohydrolase family protein [Emcibacter sp.]